LYWVCQDEETVSQFSRFVHVYETDMMGVVHHSNYLRFCEEARVHWCRSNNLIENTTNAVFGLTVIGAKVEYRQAIRFGEKVDVVLQARTEGVRLIIQYRLSVDNDLRCVAETVHCSLDLSFKVKRLDPKLIIAARNSKWTETWL